MVTPNPGPRQMDSIPGIMFWPPRGLAVEGYCGDDPDVLLLFQKRVQVILEK